MVLWFQVWRSVKMLAKSGGYGSRLGQLVGDDVPKDGRVNTEVLVSKDITKAGDLLPLYFGSATTEIRRQVLRRFPDDLKISNTGMLSLQICHELLTVQAFSEAVNIGNGLENVIEVDACATRHTTSRGERCLGDLA